MNLLLATCPFFFLNGLGIFCLTGATPKPIIRQEYIEMATGPIMDEFTYVDKTRFIPPLLYHKSNRFLLQRPRRFGKTMLLRTLQAALDRHRNGEEILRGTFLSNPTSGWTWQKYPLLYFDFSRGELSEVLQAELDRFKEVECITQIPKKCQYNTSTAAKKTTPEVQLLRGLLCAIHAKNRENQTTVILVDEYDHFVLGNSNDQVAANEAHTILNDFFVALKSEAHLIKLAFVTGVSRFPYVTSGSAGGDLEDISRDSQYGEIAGITDDELGTFFLPHIQDVANHRNISPDEVKDELKTWYNGYSFTGGESLYNPFSLTLYFKHKKPGVYWGNTGQTTYFWDQMKMRPEDFENLEDTVTSDLTVKGDVNIEHPHILMHEAGYFTIHEADTNIQRYVLGFANAEVRQAFLENLIAAKDLDQRRSVTPQIRVMKKALEEKVPDFDEFIGALNAAIQRLSFNFEDEAGYHAVIYLLLQQCCFRNLICEHKIKGNRIDVTFQTRYTSFLFELKLEHAGIKVTWDQVKGSIPSFFYGSKTIFSAAILISPSGQRGVAITQWKAKLLDNTGKEVLKEFDHENSKWFKEYWPKKTKKTGKNSVLKNSKKKTQEKASINGSHESTPCPT